MLMSDKQNSEISSQTSEIKIEMKLGDNVLKLCVIVQSPVVTDCTIAALSLSSPSWLQDSF